MIAKLAQHFDVESNQAMNSDKRIDDKLQGKQVSSPPAVSD